MADSSGNKTGGREVGTPNKTTNELKEFYKDLLGGETVHIKAALKKLRDKDPHQYLMAIDKISNKVVANKKDITSDDKPIQPAINIRENRAEPKTD